MGTQHILQLSIIIHNSLHTFALIHQTGRNTTNMRQNAERKETIERKLLNKLEILQ